MDTCKHGHFEDHDRLPECVNEFTADPTDRDYDEDAYGPRPYIPPAGWSKPDNRGHVQFTLVGKPRLDDKAPVLEGFECFFVALTDNYTRWTYRPVDTPVQQARLAVIDAQRSLAMLDVGLNILRGLSPVTQAMFRQNEQAIAHVVNAKNTLVEMQDGLLATLPDDVRESVVRRSRIGAEHLRGR